MSVARAQFSDDPWIPKPFGWRLLFQDRLLWIALGLSALAHLALLAPRYGIHLPERGAHSLNVSFRAAGQALAHAPPTRPEPARHPTSRLHSIPLATSPHAPPAKATLVASARTAAPSPSILATPPTGGAATHAPRVEARRVALNANVKDYRYSQYLSDWRNKVERIGAMNYPEEARGRFFGSLVLSVALRPDGSVDRITVLRSSGNKVLDDAAKRIVTMAAPFAPFPPDIRQETDYLDITRTWTFTRSDALETR